MPALPAHLGGKDGGVAGSPGGDAGALVGDGDDRPVQAGAVGRCVNE